MMCVFSEGVLFISPIVMVPMPLLSNPTFALSNVTECTLSGILTDTSVEAVRVRMKPSGTGVSPSSAVANAGWKLQLLTEPGRVAVPSA